MFTLRKIVVFCYILLLGVLLFKLVRTQTNQESQCGTEFCTATAAKEINALINQKTESKNTMIFKIQVVYGSVEIKDLSENKIDDEIKKLNQLFAVSKIKFILNKRRLIKKTNLSIDEFYFNTTEKEKYIAKLEKNYINLIFVKKGDDYSGFTAIPKTSFLRYLALENSFNNIFISANLEYPLGTIAHEFGHFFGLQHTFGSNLESYSTKEKTELNNCNTEGDFICDTPPDNNTGAFSNCDIVIKLDGNSIEKDFEYPPVLNFMSYSPNKCRTEFTPMQYSLMEKFALTYRKRLIMANY